MPKIINEYANENPLVTALQGFAGSFGGNTAQTEMYRQKAMGLGRENTNIPLLADAVVGNDPALTAKLGILSGVDPKVTGGYRQYYGVQKFGPGSSEATRDTMSVPGANYGNTVQGTNAEMANRRGIAQMTTDRALAADKFKFDNTFETVMDPVTKQPTLVPRSQAAGRQPFLPLSQVQGGILQQDMPTLTPPQRAAAGGYAPKNPTTIYNGRVADGSIHPTADGKTSLQTGEPIVGAVQKIEGPDASGLGRNPKAINDLIQSRVGTGTALDTINRLKVDLAKPNSGAAIGILGSGAELFNNARAQIESATKLVGGEDFVQAYASPENTQAVGRAVNVLFGNPQFNQHAQRLGIDAAILRSRIQELAYAIAKAREPGGRLGVNDIERAASTIGASLGDPHAMSAVLDDVATGLTRSQAIREQVYQQYYGKDLPGGTAAVPPQSAASIAPTAPQQSDPLGIR